MTMTSRTMNGNPGQGTETDEECQHHNAFHDDAGLREYRRCDDGDMMMMMEGIIRTTKEKDMKGV